MDENIIIVLDAGIVVDQSKLPKDHVLLGHMLGEVYKAGLPVTIVPNFAGFFTPKNLFEMLENGDRSWVLIAQKLELRLDPSDVAVVQRYAEIKKEATEKFTPAYPFAAVPPGWSIETSIAVLNNGSTRRTSTFQIEGYQLSTSYALGVKSLQNLWGVASLFWAGKSTNHRCNVRQGQYENHNAIIGHTYISVGCQRVYRFELEQLALAKNWTFP